MDQVHFTSDQDVILTESQPLLVQVAEIIKIHPEWESILIEGHCDSRAGDAHNLDLSQRRAQSVLQFLVSRGVEPSRLRAQGFGRSRPIAPNTTEEGMAQNRRVEFTIERARPPAVSPSGPPGTL
jgi:outer membrane protein OmpA-like peptidoglycan-associated protein